MIALGLVLTILSGPASSDTTTVVIVVGAEGTPEYGRAFRTWADRWETVARQAGSDVIRIGEATATSETDRDRLFRALDTEQVEASGELWLVLIGHGTFDSRRANFNLRGPDVSAEELLPRLAAISGPLALVNCASSSGPFVTTLAGAGANRVVISATKSGFEQNYARFGDYLSQAIGSPESDLDKDAQTSLLEAFLTASRRTQEYYETQGRLVTEHALLDDDGDGLGVRAEHFRGVRPVASRSAGGSVDGLRAHQVHLLRSPGERQLAPEVRRRRDTLELEVIRFRQHKAESDDESYYRELESRLLPLAELYEQAETGRH